MQVIRRKSNPVTRYVPVGVTEKDYENLDRVSAEMGIGRSTLVRQALQAYLANVDSSTVTAA
ncbi:MAG: ribbon-helix-helix domain-containing protein [Scytolyngbya sp. HA4215-MV1]|nr:ribbon-helix-helix domain-containing protein [Scytolyngbya sp. HA4215-MV1]